MYAQYSGINDRAKMIPALFGLNHQPNQNSNFSAYFTHMRCLSEIVCSFLHNWTSDLVTSIFLFLHNWASDLVSSIFSVRGHSGDLSDMKMVRMLVMMVLLVMVMMISPPHMTEAH